MRYFGWLVFAVIFSQLTFADTGLKSRIDNLLTPRFKNTRPGCAVGVSQGKKSLYEGYFGLADIKNQKPIGPDTRFEINSDSKQFTGAAIAILIQEGRLKETDSVCKYFSEWKAKGKCIFSGLTISDLIHHTSGLPEYNDLVSNERNKISETEVLRRVSIYVAHKGRKFKPGTLFQYNNTNYLLLAVLVRKISTRNLEDFAKEEIFTPLKMKQTEFFTQHAKGLPGLAKGYSVNASGGRVRSDESQSDIIGDGGVVSNLHDLMIWQNFLATDQIGNRKGIATIMRTPGKKNYKPGGAYGFGIRLSQYKNHPIEWHAGEFAGYTSQITRFTDRNLSIIVLCNLAAPDNTPYDPGVITDEVADLIFSVPQLPESPGSPHIRLNTRDAAEVAD